MASHRAQTLSALEAQNEALQALAKSSQQQEEASQVILTKSNSINQSMGSIYTMLQKIYQAVVDMQYQATNSRFFAGPDPSFGKGIIIDDALGNTIEINWELVNSWNASCVEIVIFYDELIELLSFWIVCWPINSRD